MRARPRSAPSARTWLRFEIPRRRGTTAVSTGRSGGSAISIRTNPVHAQGHPGGQRHAGDQGKRRPPARTACGAGCRASSSGRAPGRAAAARRRRRRAAQDPGQELPVAARPAVLARRRRPRSRTGIPRTSSMSVTSPARAKMPSNRSWLSSAFSGTRPASAPRTRRRRRCPCRCRTFAEEVLVDVRDRRRRRDRCRRARRRCAGRACRRARPAGTA